MQVTPLLIYSISLLDSVNALLRFLSLTGLVILFAYSVFCFMTYVEDKNIFNNIIKHLKIILITVIIILIINCVVPSQKTVVAMYVIPAIANNEKIQAIGNNSVDILKNLTEKWVKETLNIQDEKK